MPWLLLHHENTVQMASAWFIYHGIMAMVNFQSSHGKHSNAECFNHLQYEQSLYKQSYSVWLGQRKGGKFGRLHSFPYSIPWEIPRFLSLHLFSWIALLICIFCTAAIAPGALYHCHSSWGAMHTVILKSLVLSLLNNIVNKQHFGGDSNNSLSIITLPYESVYCIPHFAHSFLCVLLLCTIAITLWSWMLLLVAGRIRSSLKDMVSIWFTCYSLFEFFCDTNSQKDTKLRLWYHQ